MSRPGINKSVRMLLKEKPLCLDFIGLIFIRPEKCSEPCLVTGGIWLRAIYELLRKKNNKKTTLTPGKIALKSPGLVSNFDTFMAKTELPLSFINRRRSQGISVGIERFFNDTEAYTEVTGVNRVQLCSQWCHTGGEARALWILAYKNSFHFSPLKPHLNIVLLLLSSGRETAVNDIKTTFTLSLTSILPTTDPCFFFYRVVTSNITHGNYLISFFFLSSFASVPKSPHTIFRIKVASDYR